MYFFFLSLSSEREIPKLFQAIVLYAGLLQKNVAPSLFIGNYDINNNLASPCSMELQTLPVDEFPTLIINYIMVIIVPVISKKLKPHFDRRFEVGHLGIITLVVHRN